MSLATLIRRATVRPRSSTHEVESLALDGWNAAALSIATGVLLAGFHCPSVALELTAEPAVYPAGEPSPQRPTSQHDSAGCYVTLPSPHLLWRDSARARSYAVFAVRDASATRGSDILWALLNVRSRASALEAGSSSSVAALNRSGATQYRNAWQQRGLSVPCPGLQEPPAYVRFEIYGLATPHLDLTGIPDATAAAHLVRSLATESAHIRIRTVDLLAAAGWRTPTTAAVGPK